MIKIGITGQNGFVGTHLYNTLGTDPERYERIDFHKSCFENEDALKEFVGKCDVIVHLAALNRHPDPEEIYKQNVGLVKKLVSALETTGSKAHLIFSSSSQEERDNLYGKSKREGREILAQWAKEHHGTFTGMVIPNVFGPFGVPQYNSFIATFCHQLTHGESPKVEQDALVNLIYVGDLVQEIISKINDKNTEASYQVPAPTSVKVSEVLQLLENFKSLYFENGEIPPLKTTFELQLFNTFRSYFDVKNHYPVLLKENEDNRGSFVEVIRLGIGGQCSYSTTHPGITRGNHYHSRKIERFTVIKGKALIQLRKIGTPEVLNFELDGAQPSYVDMPVWYTHNIKNIGEEELLTLFWINEAYNAEDADTFFETV